ncbi:MAG: PfkB domain protein [Solirubrobacterales bacterium]|nr:PfkB domain protein [Solirubrobacterales bacterium]
MTRVAVVGHVEWGEFAVVERVPVPGDIAHARETFKVAAGGGGVAATQLVKLAQTARFYTALGDDAEGRAAAIQFGAAGLTVETAWRGTTRRVFTFLSDDHERTITVLGERLVPHGSDDLDWDALADCDAVYFTGGDAEALRHARRARWLVATPRALDVLKAAAVPLDVLVGSATDPDEAVPGGLLDPAPRFVVRTHGGEGGEWSASEGRTGKWAAEPLPGEPVDAYGCGDAFAAGLTYGLAATDDLDEALQWAARCGAHALCGRGPYAGQLTLRNAA